MTTAVLLVLLGALSRLVPHPPNFVPLGALALYAGARLPRRWSFAVPLAAMVVSDFFLDFGTGRSVLSLGRVVIYATFALLTLLGRGKSGTDPIFRAFRKPWSVPGLAALSVGASCLFFVTSNFAVWAAGSLYPRTLAGLGLCYAAAIPFFWNTLAADLAGTATFFGLDALSKRVGARAALRASAAAVMAVVALGSTALAQAPPPLSDSVVVTATLTPEEERELGSATTVLTREWIEATGARNVADLLRQVPGLDVARQGSDGSLVSAFLRGANSPHVLVLMDGARLNSPYFSGYDFSVLTTENVERIEIVRGPFSALYGSDAIGGVIHIFTRPASTALSGRVALERGEAGLKHGSAFATAGSPGFGATASYSHDELGGDRANSDWRQDAGSVRLEGRFGDRLQVALEGSLVDADVGTPGPVGRETPRARQESREERLQLPVSFRPLEGHDATLLFARVASERTYSDPDAGFDSRSNPTTWQARLSDSFHVGRHELTGFTSWERWQVDDRSNFGVALDDDRSTLWGAGFQDSVALGGGAVATAGLRYDHHSDFGDAWSPRGTIAWTDPTARWKLRVSGGSAFRAPSVGELFYPFGGNPNLKPERVTSWEAGVERYFADGRLEVSLFWNELRNLIVFDFASSLNENVGRARTRGVEVAWRQKISKAVEVDAGYTWLEAKDRSTGADLRRRPRHRAFLSAALSPIERLTLSPRVTFVGRRGDADAITGTDTQLPSYVRADVFARYDLGRLAPYARLENATDRRYEEVDGYPAPRRRWSAGMEVHF
ncbi:MAG TPA: TonB-dependent receptor [Thermoanaerobaculia bacterium]|nr:TonB-dependent receptor [Thermoanaerobaculia bacterium]